MDGICEASLIGDPERFENLVSTRQNVKKVSRPCDERHGALCFSSSSPEEGVVRVDECPRNRQIPTLNTCFETTQRDFRLLITLLAALAKHSIPSFPGNGPHEHQPQLQPDRNTDCRGLLCDKSITIPMRLA